MLERKSVRAELKAVDDRPGVFEARFAVFNNVDRVGDRILSGAFSRTLEERGLPPVVWSHRWDVPPIGETLDAKETDEGVEATGRLFIDGDKGEDHATAREVYVGLKTRALKEYSFAYEVVDAAEVTENGETIRELRDVELFEWGPTLVGVNPATETIRDPKSIERLLGVSAKDLRAALGIEGDELAEALEVLKGLKAGARNSGKDLERLQQIHDLAVANGAECRSPEDDDDGKALDPAERARRAELLAFPL